MKIVLKEWLTYKGNCGSFEKDGARFYINRSFIRKTKKGTVVVFPHWATQIYVKHNEMMYEIFLQDFCDYIERQVPIPFQNHFPKPVDKTLKRPRENSR